MSSVNYFQPPLQLRYSKIQYFTINTFIFCGALIATILVGFTFLNNKSRLLQAETTALYHTNALIEPAAMQNMQSGNIAMNFVYPTIGEITQQFSKKHPAIDIANPHKPFVWATKDGIVATVSDKQRSKGYGKYIELVHADGYRTRYAHLDKIFVKKSETVKAKTIIGRMGRTGAVKGRTGIHLHFEVLKDGKPIPPLHFFEGEKIVFQQWLCQNSTRISSLVKCILDAPRPFTVYMQLFYLTYGKFYSSNYKLYNYFTGTALGVHRKKPEWTGYPFDSIQKRVDSKETNFLVTIFDTAMLAVE